MRHWGRYGVIPILPAVSLKITAADRWWNETVSFCHTGAGPRAISSSAHCSYASRGPEAAVWDPGPAVLRNLNNWLTLHLITLADNGGSGSFSPCHMEAKVISMNIDLVVKKACCMSLVMCCLPSLLKAQSSGEAKPQLKWSGDFRARYEFDADRTGKPDRTRTRIRFRLAGEAEVLPGLHVAARMVTAPNRRDPNSTHQTLGEGFQDFQVALDRAYVKWKVPAGVPVNVLAGKFGNPFATSRVFSELVWDADIQPEGLAVMVEPVPGLKLVGAQYVLLHRSPGEYVGMTAFQAAGSGRVAEKWSAAGGIGVYAYQRPDGIGAPVLARENQGNALLTSVAGDTLDFLSRFNVVHSFGAITYRWKVPVVISGQYVANPSAKDGFDDNGFAVGLEVGSLGTPGAWRFQYQYQEIGREAIYSAFAQDDFLNATNMRGHLFGLAVQIRKRVNVNIWNLWSATEVPRVDKLQKRFRVDLNVSF